VCFTGSSKSTDVSKKAEEAVKTGRLVVTGQLLEMLSKGQRHRPAASSSVTDKTRKAPLTCKFRGSSTKDSTGSHSQSSAVVLQLQTGAGVNTLAGSAVKLEHDEVTPASDTSTSADQFCPLITSVVSLDDNKQ